jgi:outer membrane lipoprotein-sorting protein
MKPVGGLPGKCLLFVVAAALLAVTQAAPATATLTADEIVARHVAASGGLKKIRSIQTLRETGRINAGAGREALVTRERKRPDCARFEITLQGVTGVLVSDGEHGWKVSPFDGDEAPTPLPDEVVREAAEQGDLEGPLVDYKAKGHQVELAGREQVGGRDAYKLKVTLKSGTIRTEYLDATTFYRVRTDTTRQVRGRPVRIETTFTDFKKTNGIPFPRLIEVAAAGRPQRLTITVEKIEVNPPLSDSLFQMPEPSKP